MMDAQRGRRFAVVGAGFAGAVIARELARHTDRPVVVFDERPHVAGNCHTERDPATGVMVHRFGPHIFHTNRRDIWDYVNGFDRLHPFVNRVKAHTARGVFSFPINLLTINQFFGKSFNPAEARAFVASRGDHSIGEPANFEEQALKFVGRELYETFLYGYTRKQWGCEPRDIPASVLKRLPVRFTYDDGHYDSQFQGIPESGYTVLVRRILDLPGIEVRLDERFDPERTAEFRHVFYTGPIDAFFRHQYGRLNYRTVTFERIDGVGDLQGNAVINYTELRVPQTRIHEHKHFTPWESHRRTVAFAEFSKATTPDDMPYYPVRRPADKQVLNMYYRMVLETRGVSFLGRLATYRYLDMDSVVGESLDFAKVFLHQDAASRPAYPRVPPAVAAAIVERTGLNL
jgi:UDP-galactopyranose mutase